MILTVFLAQTINVALDLASPDFWVFGVSSPSQLTTRLKSGVFDLSATTQIYIPEPPIYTISHYNQWMYEDSFQATVEQVRASVTIGDISLGIPYVGVNKNRSGLTAYILQAGGLFGIQRNYYANTIAMRANYDSILTLYTPKSVFKFLTFQPTFRIPKTRGRLVTGNSSITECGTHKFMYYKLAGDNINLTSYFSFNSPL